jgi:glycosyltransferase involved in cell wall biosynthesis
MRILAITNLYPNPLQPHRATFNRHQFRLLNDLHPIRVIAPIAWTDEWRALRSGGEPLPSSRQVILDGLTVEHPRYLFPPKIGRRWYGHCYEWSVRRTVRRIAEQFQPDLLFAPWAYPDGWSVVRMGRELKLPVVVRVHGSDIKLLDQFPARKRLTSEAVTQADGVVAVSQDLAVELERLGADPKTIQVMYDGVDGSQFFPGSQQDARLQLKLPLDRRIVLFVGNLVPVKGVDVLLRAMAELKDFESPHHLALVGDGGLRPYLTSLAQTLGIADRTTFVGSIPHSELGKWYRAANLFVLPSHSEGVPNVVLEAAACGCPWIATRVGGLPEIAHLGQGRLVPPNDPHALAEAIRESWTCPPQTQGTQPRERAEAVAELAEFLERIVQKRGTP